MFDRSFVAVRWRVQTPSRNDGKAYSLLASAFWQQRVERFCVLAASCGYPCLFKNLSDKSGCLRDSRPVSKRALAHLRADPAMAGLIDRIGPVKLCPRRLPPFQSLTHAIIHQ